MKVSVEGKMSNDPRDRVEAVGGLAHALSHAVGECWDDAAVTLVVAAVLMTMRGTGETTPSREMANQMAKLVAHAMVLAEHILHDEMIADLPVEGHA